MKITLALLIFLNINILYSAPPKKKFYLSSPTEENRLKRAQIENFLCSIVPNLIKMENIKKKRVLLPPIENIRELLKKSVIEKWYEKNVTYRLTGAFSKSDSDIVKDFFRRVNVAAGYKQFIQQSGEQVSNITIHFNTKKESFLFYSVSGEATIPKITWILKFRYNGKEVEWDKIVTRFKGDFTNYTSIKYSKEELAFSQNNRVVKIVVGNNARIPSGTPGRKRTIVHELLHGIGFIGHSIYPSSALFPSSTLSKGFDEKLTYSLLDYLYRPDILPGMNLLEAERVIRKPFISNPSKTELQKSLLKKRSQNILEEAKVLLEGEFKGLLDLTKLVDKENLLYEELREVHRDQNLSTMLIDIIAASSNLNKKLAITQAEKGKVTQKIENLKENKNIRKKEEKILLLNDRLVVLKDILTAILKTHIQRVKVEKFRKEGALLPKLEKDFQSNLIQLEYIENLISRQKK